MGRPRWIDRETDERHEARMRRRLRLERVDADALCPSGTLVLCLLALGWCLSEVEEAALVPRGLLASTLRPGRGRYVVGRERLDSGAWARLEALVGVAVGRGCQDASQVAKRGLP